MMLPNADRGAITGIEDIFTRTLEKKNYELTDHLGNVRSVITDMKLPDGSDGFLPEATTRNYYYPFGMERPLMTASTGGNDYRFGYNGKENDRDWNKQDYGFRTYDPRVARFLSIDPIRKNYPSWSPYPFAMNRPIDGIDLDGLEFVPANFTANVGINKVVTKKSDNKDIEKYSDQVNLVVNHIKDKYSAFNKYLTDNNIQIPVAYAKIEDNNSEISETLGRFVYTFVDFPQTIVDEAKYKQWYEGISEVEKKFLDSEFLKNTTDDVKIKLSPVDITTTVLKSSLKDLAILIDFDKVYKLKYDYDDKEMKFIIEKTNLLVNDLSQHEVGHAMFTLKYFSSDFIKKMDNDPSLKEKVHQKSEDAAKAFQGNNNKSNKSPDQILDEHNPEKP